MALRLFRRIRLLPGVRLQQLDQLMAALQLAFRHLATRDNGHDHDMIAKKITKRLLNVRPLPMHVFVNNRGKPWTQWGVSSAMRRADADFAIRQLRAKAQTDSPENVLGHEGQCLITTRAGADCARWLRQMARSLDNRTIRAVVSY